MYIEYFNLLSSGDASFVYLLGGIFLLVISFISFKLRFRIKRIFLKVLPYMSIILAVIFLVIFVNKSKEYKKYKNILIKGQHKVLEGVVEELNTIEPGVRDYETLIVNGVTFKYSDFKDNIGFKNSVYMGGPLYLGAEVRIFYYNNVILALWIKE